MMKTLPKSGTKGKKEKVLGEVNIVNAVEYQETAIDVRLEMIRSLIPLGLMHIQDELEAEVTQLAGERYQRQEANREVVRHGSNPGSIALSGQRHPIRVPRVRNRKNNSEVPLQTMERLREGCTADEVLMKRVLYGISCRNYEAAAEAVPGAIGLSSSTVSRKFKTEAAKVLKEFQERDLSDLDLVALWLDGKSFVDDMMVVALGLTLEGRKVPLGFVHTGSENKATIAAFLRELETRGLTTNQGILVIIDGGKGLRAAVKQVFKQGCAIQRCQWHKRENVVSYLPKNEQETMRQQLQQAYKKATYKEAKTALMKIHVELEKRNISAASSLSEGLEETLTLHRLGVYEQLGTSLKTTNCIESVMSRVEEICGKVSHWKNSKQKHQWLAVALMDIEPRLNRIRGYRNLPLLREAIQHECNLVGQQSVA
jgi:transposase-like protein